MTEERYRAVGESLDGRMLLRIRLLAKELKVYLLVGFAESRNGKMFNSAVIFSPAGELTLRYSKSHNAHDEPYNTKSPTESRRLRGDGTPCFPLQGARG